MATVKGQNLRIFLGNGDSTPIAAALQCDLSVQLNVQQYTTKDDEGAWAKNMAVSLSWSVKANGAVTTDPTRNDAASMMARVGQIVHLQLALAGGDLNSEKGDTILAGDAIITDVNITAQNRTRGTFDVTFTGQKNMLFPLNLLVSSNPSHLVSSDGHTLAAGAN